MINEFKAVFANNYIKLGNKVVRPFSIAWWIVRAMEVVIGVLSFYFLYCFLWMMAA